MSMFARSIEQTISTGKEDFYEWTQTDETFSVDVVPGIPREAFKRLVLMMEKKRSSYSYARMKLHFSEPSSVVVRGKYKQVTELTCYFFEASGSGQLCYSVGKSSGPHLEYMDWCKIQKIEIVHPQSVVNQKKQEVSRDKLWKKICKARYDDQTWSDLKPEKGWENRFYYIKKAFKPWDMRIIQRGFEEKVKFSFRNDSDSKNGRDFSAEGRLGDDGIYRAWFSSEFPGCGNGDYYMLLNPRLALFIERD